MSLSSRALGSAVAIVALVSMLSEGLPTAQAATRSTLFVRGAYGRDTSATGTDVIKSTGFNTVTVSPLSAEIDRLDERGLKGVVWLWDYDNGTCSFQKTDEWVRSQVLANLDNHAVLAYQIADEPNAEYCPAAPAQLRARSDLIRSIDPDTPTFIAMSIRNGNEYYPYQHFVDSADIMGLVVYPCTWTYDCRFGMISYAVEQARLDGVGRFWAVMQDFGKEGGWYRQPSAEELAAQFDAWASSGMEGYLVYHWGVGELDKHPDHLAVLAEQNARVFTDPKQPSPPGKLKGKRRKAIVRLRWKAAQDDVGVTAYETRINDSEVDITDSLSWQTRRPRLKWRTYSVVAIDAARNRLNPEHVRLR